MSAELKVGLISIAVIVVFIWLFSYLKGNNLFSRIDTYHVYYDNVAGLDVSSPVEINGLKAGVVESVKLVNDGRGIVEVFFNIRKGIRLPENTIAEITTETLIAGMKIVLIPGSGSNWLSPGDVLQGRVAISIFDKVDSNFDPIVIQTRNTISKLDTLLTNLNELINDEFAGNLGSSAANLESASSDLKQVLGSSRVEITELITNLNRIASVINNKSANIDSTINNINQITTSINEAGLDSTLHTFRLSLEATQQILEGLNSGEGSAGKLVKDDSLYFNLSRSLESLDRLIKDIEENPGRYVNISIFGNKKK